MSRTLPRTSIFDIPDEVLTEIIARVAECDPINLVAAQLTCKQFLFSGDTNDVYLRVALGFFPYNIKSFGKNLFFEKCFQTENPEAIFWKGTADINFIFYFTVGDKETRVNHLGRAIDKGHLATVYAMRMIQIFEGLLASNDGCDLLNALCDSVGDIWKFAQISGVVHSVLHNIPHAIVYTN